MRRKKKRSPLTALVVILCLALLGGAGYLLWRALPQKKSARHRFLTGNGRRF